MNYIKIYFIIGDSSNASVVSFGDCSMNMRLGRLAARTGSQILAINQNKCTKYDTDIAPFSIPIYLALVS